MSDHQAFRAFRAAALPFALLLGSCAPTPPPTTTAASPAVSESRVTVATRDGIADALLFEPEGRGPWPAVVVWSDLTGLRPAFRKIGHRLAAEGYVVLVPNIFYRTARIDGSGDPATLTPDQARERSSAWMDAIGDEGGEADAKAYLAFLDSRPRVDTSRPAGALAYQYGSPYAFHAAFVLPERIRAVAVIHPMRIATARANSPHLFVGRSQAAYYVALAGPDDAREPGDKEDLRKAFADARLAGTVEVLLAGNGFGVSDLEAYDRTAAEAAWHRTLVLFRAQLQ